MVFLSHHVILKVLVLARLDLKSYKLVPVYFSLTHFVADFVPPAKEKKHEQSATRCFRTVKCFQVHLFLSDGFYVN